MRFVDLFAGLGGFHLAMTRLGHRGVFASESDPELARLYALNHGLKPHGDIRSSYPEIPPHDLLCAGFPCQPFSKAGDQKGFDCPQWGDLFDYVMKIIVGRKPRYVIIENVPNLMHHNGGRTWERILTRIRSAGYAVDSAVLSPHLFGVPQIRNRAIIVASRDGLDNFKWPKAHSGRAKLDIRNVLDKCPKDARPLGDSFIKYLTAWQALLDKLPVDAEIPSFPIWAMEFGATYPVEPFTPSRQGLLKIRRWRGAFGDPLRGMTSKEVWAALPAYARDESDAFPPWKIAFIKQNRAFYREHREIIDEWLPTIRDFAPSFQKLEWNWKGGPRNIWNTVIQFRASGIRAKRPTSAPSLVALTTSQVPVIPWERRYMSMRECARLQSMDALHHLPATPGAAYKALGNAVNVDVIEAVAKALLPLEASVSLSSVRAKAPAKKKTSKLVGLKARRGALREKGPNARL